MVSEEQQHSDLELESERIPVPQTQKTAEQPVECQAGEVIGEVGVAHKPNISRGKPRLRKRALQAAILKQMEFYFSDANLSKDRYLGNLVMENPYVDLQIFLRFNKIRALTDDVHRISKALRDSTILSLSEDGMKVCRVSPVKIKENVEDCTVYVQNLPPGADHEWLTSIFKTYGTVAYVSIPRYKTNRKIKGFAFIEFDNSNSANNCMQAFREKGCELPSQTAPNELMSIVTFNEAECQEQQQSSDNKRKHESDGIKTNEEPSDKRRKFKSEEEGMGNEGNEAESEQSDSSAKKSKKRAKKQQEESDAQESNSEASTKRRKKQKESENLDQGSSQPKTMKGDKETTEAEETEQEGENNKEKSEKKKKKRKKRHARSEGVDVTEMGLQVMAKHDWKRLRNKYLALQRQKMQQLKLHLRKTRRNQWGASSERKEYYAPEPLQPKKMEIDEKPKPKGVSFVPGAIVKLTMNEPCADPQAFKRELKGNSYVKYIDIKEGDNVAYVRCDTAENAKVFSQKTQNDRSSELLEGDEEHAYWEKISADRQDKVENKVRTKQRGRDKLLKKAEKELGKHIKFDEV